MQTPTQWPVVISVCIVSPVPVRVSPLLPFRLCTLHNGRWLRAVAVTEEARTANDLSEQMRAMWVNHTFFQSSVWNPMLHIKK